ncbi:MAG: ATP synthase F1 subunit epsilon [Candidatus Glassbacteria bacterium]
MHEPIKTRLITQEKVIFEGEVRSVVAPAANGQLGILSKHAPLMAALGRGVLKITVGTEKKFFAVVGGFLQVKDNNLILLADQAVPADNIDRVEAEERVTLLRSKLDTGGVKGKEKWSLAGELEQAKVLAHAARLAEEERQLVRT